MSKHTYLWEIRFYFHSDDGAMSLYVEDVAITATGLDAAERELEEFIEHHPHRPYIAGYELRDTYYDNDVKVYKK